MAWSGKNHLENLQDILLNLQWLIQPDTVFTEMPYDIEFLKQSDVVHFVEWCPRIVSKQEFEEGRYMINKYLIRFFVARFHPDLSEDAQEEKADLILREVHKLLKLSEYESIHLNPRNISKIFDETQNKPGESHIDKTKKRIKLAISLRWLQSRDLFEKLSQETKEYIKQVGDLYGLLNQDKNIDITSLKPYSPPPDDVSKITEDYETRVEIALLSISQDIKEALKNLPQIKYDGLGIVMKVVDRLRKFVEKKHPPEYDKLKRFKDAVFITLILNYVKDPYIHNTPDARNVVKLIVPVYLQFKKLETLI